jgi:catechol 2,3-dioxygenase-like lactoylglutathione lyase family enzyme
MSGACFGAELVQPGATEGEALVGRFVGVCSRVDDLHERYETLTKKGVKFTLPPEKQDWGGSLTHVQDPDGNTFTLLG